MINQFELAKTGLPDYSFISLSIDYSRPDEYLYAVADELKELSYKGKVIFDLVISNGLSGERFYEAYFNGCEFDSLSFHRRESVPSSILDISNKFYIRNIHVLDNSVLTKAQKFLFKRALEKHCLI